jgi:hypothetical protein
MKTIKADRVKELALSWQMTVEKEKGILTRIKEIYKILDEPALLKHIDDYSNRILTRQSCILDLQEVIMSALDEQLEPR